MWYENPYWVKLILVFIHLVSFILSLVWYLKFHIFYHMTVTLQKAGHTCNPLKFWNIEGTKSPMITLNAIRVPRRRPIILKQERESNHLTKNNKLK